MHVDLQNTEQLQAALELQRVTRGADSCEDSETKDPLLPIGPVYSPLNFGVRMRAGALWMVWPLTDSHQHLCHMNQRDAPPLQNLERRRATHTRRGTVHVYLAGVNIDACNTG